MRAQPLLGNGDVLFNTKITGGGVRSRGDGTFVGFTCTSEHQLSYLGFTLALDIRRLSF